MSVCGGGGRRRIDSFSSVTPDYVHMYMYYTYNIIS